MNLVDAIVNNEAETVKELLNQGADPNMSLDDADVKPLHFAAQHNLLEIGKLLLAAGADPFARTNPDQQTPLEIAHMHDHEQFVNLLLKHTKDKPDYLN